MQQGTRNFRVLVQGVFAYAEVLQQKIDLFAEGRRFFERDRDVFVGQPEQIVAAALKRIRHFHKFREGRDVFSFQIAVHARRRDADARGKFRRGKGTFGKALRKTLFEICK